MMRRWLVASLLALAACGAGEDEVLFSPGVVELRNGERSVEIQVEIAENAAAHERGLMFRDALDEGHGMVFVWPQAGNVAMWMKNTRMPLDMVFARDGAVTGVVAWAKPFDETPLSPGESSDFVLEIPGGYAAKTGIGSGWRVTLRRE